MSTGDMITFAGGGLISGIIRLATPRSHIAPVVRLMDYEGVEKRRFCLEAGPYGISLMLLSERLKTYNGRAWWLPLRPEMEPIRRYMGLWAFKQLGVKYDYLGLFSNALGRVSEDARKFFCSEFGWMAVRAGIAEICMRDLPGAKVLARNVEDDAKKIKGRAARPGDFLSFTGTFQKEFQIL